MSDPTPIARVLPFTKDVLHTLVELAFAVSDYESAWREYLGERNTTRLGELNERQEQLRTALSQEKFIDGTPIPYEFVVAIEGALVLAVARVSGERPAEHREDASFSSADRGYKFIYELLRGPMEGPE